MSSSRAPIRASLVGKLRHTVPTPTPARWATSAICTLSPCSAKSSSAAASTRSRLRCASARRGRSTDRGRYPMIVVTGVPFPWSWPIGSYEPKRNHASTYTSRHHENGDAVAEPLRSPRSSRGLGRGALRQAVVDPRGALPQPAHRLRRQLEPQRRHPHAVPRARTPPTRSSSGSSPIYSLVFAGLLFSTGALGDRFGRKGALQFGLARLPRRLPSLASMSHRDVAAHRLPGASWARRAAFIMPSTLSILVNVFPPHERTKAIAIWASVTGAAGAIGPVASGWLLGHFWYGSVFLVNVPIIVVALVAGWFLVPKSKDPEQGAARPGRRGALDHRHRRPRLRPHRGARQRAGPAPARSVAFAVALVVLAALRRLGAARRRADARHALLQNPAFSTGTGGMILVFLAMYGVMFLITQYFQLVLGYSPLGVGAAAPADGADHDHRRPAHAAAHRAVRRQPRRSPAAWC